MRHDGAHAAHQGRPPQTPLPAASRHDSTGRDPRRCGRTVHHDGLRRHLDQVHRGVGRDPPGLAVPLLQDQGRHPLRAAWPNGRSDPGAHSAAAGRHSGAHRGRAPARTGGLRRRPTAQRALESRRAVPTPRATGRQAGTLLVGPRTAAVALPGAEPGRHRAHRRQRRCRRPAGAQRSELPLHVADACLRVLGLPDEATSALRARTLRELAPQLGCRPSLSDDDQESA